MSEHSEDCQCHQCLNVNFFGAMRDGMNYLESVKPKQWRRIAIQQTLELARFSTDKSSMVDKAFKNCMTDVLMAKNASDAMEAMNRLAFTINKYTDTDTNQSPAVAVLLKSFGNLEK